MPPGPVPRRSHAMLERHRNLEGGWARAGVFGVSDGLLSNVSLVVGVAGADVSASFVRLSGIAGLIAGAISMAAGEYISVKAQRELYERELQLERGELAGEPEAELRELAAIYEERGLPPARAREVAQILSRDPELALRTHAREELGINPDDLGSPWRAAGASFVAFALGASLPVIPWFFASGTAAIVWSIVLGVLASLVVGALLGVLAGRSALRSALRQALILLAGTAVTFTIGRAVGVGTSG